MPSKEQQAKFNEVYNALLASGAAHPEVIAAQWALESGWGKAPSGKNNLFGIKAGNGDPNNKEKGTVLMTSEVIDGVKKRMPQKFRDYDTIQDSIADRVKFTVENPRYRKAGYFDAKTPAEAAAALQRGHYAGDNPTYAKSLIDVMKSAGLDPYKGSNRPLDAMDLDSVNPQQYDYSTTEPLNTALQKSTSNPLLQLFAPSDTQAVSTAPQIAPSVNNDLSAFEASFNQMNDTHTQPSPTSLVPSMATQSDAPLTAEPQSSVTPTNYDAQLAAAFGVAPTTEGKIPDYIGEMIKSIYEAV